MSFTVDQTEKTQLLGSFLPTSGWGTHGGWTETQPSGSAANERAANRERVGQQTAAFIC